MDGASLIGLIFGIAMIVAACVILSKKNRGWGYYVLAILFPLIGLIVALCLKEATITDRPDTPQRLALSQYAQNTSNDTASAFG